MVHFEIGDKVKCVDPPDSAQLNSDEVYEVTYVMYMPGTLGQAQLISVNKWPMMLWNSRRFARAD